MARRDEGRRHREEPPSAIAGSAAWNTPVRVHLDGSSRSRNGRRPGEIRGSHEEAGFAQHRSLRGQDLPEREGRDLEGPHPASGRAGLPNRSINRGSRPAALISGCARRRGRRGGQPAGSPPATAEAYSRNIPAAQPGIARPIRAWKRTGPLRRVEKNQDQRPMQAGLTQLGNGSPRRPARRFSAAMRAMRSRVATLALPKWGTIRQLDWA